MPTDPLVSFNFFVSVGPIQAAFRECHGLGSENDVVEYKASDQFGKDVYQKQPGKLKWDNITLKRGITNDLALWNWRKQVEDGDIEGARQNGSIVMYNQSGAPVASWNFERAWPSKLSGPSLNAQTNEVAIEEVVIAHEKLVRTQ
jgi:phage tail-like protein